MKPTSRMQRIPVALGGAVLAVAVAVLACEVDTPTAEPIADASDPVPVDLSASLDLEAKPLVIVDGVITSREPRTLGTDSVAPSEPTVAGTFEVSRLERDPDAVEEPEVLEGRVSGARVLRGGDSSDLEAGTVRLRGRTSVSTQDGPAPLIVVDGIIQASGTIDIPPEQIESVQVVRGAAGSELYGSRAQDGIIQIRTRTPDGDRPDGR